MQTKWRKQEVNYLFAHLCHLKVLHYNLSVETLWNYADLGFGLGFGRKPLFFLSSLPMRLKKTTKQQWSLATIASSSFIQ